jgi:hypothetical protein
MVDFSGMVNIQGVEYGMTIKNNPKILRHL